MGLNLRAPWKSQPRTAIPMTISLLLVGIVFGPSLLFVPKAVAASPKVYGFNIAGAEWSETKLPGTLNTDYWYSADPARQLYFKDRGLTLVRVPFRWERVQPKANGPLSAPDVNGLKSMLAAAAVQQQKVILVAQNFGKYYNKTLNKNDAGKFADFWNKLAKAIQPSPPAAIGEFDPLYGFELMNEPHDMQGGMATWQHLAQAATNAIRTADKAHYVLIPGYHWQTASSWRSYNEALNITDSAGPDKLLYAAHQYFDYNMSGRYTISYSDELKQNPDLENIGTTRLEPFTKWLADKGKKGIVTEYGIPRNEGPATDLSSSTNNRWMPVLDKFLQKIEDDPNLVGGAYWATGPRWFTTNDRLNVEPQWKSATIDRPQMAVLERFKSH
ncbi:MAG: cellulase family glycosylhydrolase [Chloroflexota bacterium]